MWLACPFSSRFSQPRDWAGVSFIAGGFFTSWAISKAYSGESGVTTGVLTSNTGRPQSQSQRRRCGDGNRIRSDEQKGTRNVGSFQKLEKAREWFSPGASRKHAALPIHLRLWPLELWDNTFVLFQATKFVLIRYRSHRQVIQPASIRGQLENWEHWTPLLFASPSPFDLSSTKRQMFQNWQDKKS